MKPINQLAAIVLAAAAILPCLNASALPREPDYPCYMKASNGRVFDLTASLCSGKSEPTAAPLVATTSDSSNAVADTPFIANYKERVRRIENVAAAKYLLAQADTASEKLSNLGASVCRGVNAKLDRPEIISIIEKSLPTNNQNPVLNYAGLQRISILIDMAEAGDCP